MIKFLILFMLISGLAYASAPSSSYTYVSGTVINPTQVQTNENNIYTYLQSGVDTYKAGSISEAAISSTAGILYSQLNLANSIQGSDIATNANVSIGTLSTGSNLTVNGILNTIGNVGIGSTNPGQNLDVQGTIRSLGLVVTGAILNYGSSASTGVANTVTTKIAYGQIPSLGTNVQVTNLPFTSSSSYVVICTTVTNSPNTCNVVINSASAVTFYNNGNGIPANWIAIGT